MLLIVHLVLQYNGKICFDLTGLSTPKATGVEDCNGRDKDKDLDGNEYYRCCYLESGEAKMCFPVTKDQYDEIDDSIDEYESQTGSKDVSIDCGENYIISMMVKQ